MTTLPLRCFDHRCPQHAACACWQTRHQAPYGPAANTWRRGWEWPGEPCARGRQDPPPPTTYSAPTPAPTPAPDPFTCGKRG